MRRLASAFLLAAAAAPAHAQIDPSRFNLEVFPVLRTYADNGDGTLTATDAPGGLTIDTRTAQGGGAKKIRVELRYRITVSGSTTGSYVVGTTTYASSGLGNTSINVRISPDLPTSAGVTLQPAPIGSSGNNTVATGYINPDATIDPLSGYGLYGPWRTGLTPPGQSFGNNSGTLTPNSFIAGIQPLATSNPDNRSNAGTAGPSRAWSIYAFDVSIPADFPSDQTLTIAVERGTSSGNPAPWLFFPRVNNANQSTAIQGGGPWSGGSVSLSIIGGSGCPAATTPAVSLDGCLPHVTWAAADHASGYDLIRTQVSPAGPTVTLLSNTAARTHDDATAQVGVGYQYSVQARTTDLATCPAGVGPVSAPSPTIGIPAAPAAPGAGSASLSCAGVSVTWPSSAATSLQVRRSTDGTLASATTLGAATLGANGWTYTDAAFTVGTPYTYFAVPFNGCTQGPASAGLAYTPSAGGIPGPVTNLVATAGRCDSVVITWDPVPGADFYDVAPTGGPLVQTSSTSVSLPGPTVSVQVRARNACGTGPSAFATGTTSPAPVDLFSGPVASRSTDAGAVATLSAPLKNGATYTSIQWLHDGQPVVSGPRISGAATPTLTIAPSRITDAGDYTVRLTGACYTATSDAGVLAVRKLCPADYNDQNGVDLLDIFAFLTDWFTGCP